MNKEKITEMKRLIKEGNENLQSNPKSSYDYFIIALQIAEEEMDNFLMGEALIGLAHASRSMTKITLGFKYAYKAFYVYHKVDHVEGIIRAHNFIGIFYFYSGLYEKALDHFLKAKKLISKEIPSKLIASVLNNIAETYQDMREYELSIPYYMAAFESAEETESVDYRSTIASNLGYSYFKIGDFKSSEKYYNRALEINRMTMDPICKSDVEMKFGYLMYEKGDFEKAECHFTEAEKALEETDNIYYKIDICLAKYLVSDELEFLKEANNLATGCNVNKKLVEVNLKLSNHYRNDNDYKNALDHYELYHTYQKELNELNTKNKMELLQAERNIHDNIGISETLKFRKMDQDKETLIREALYDELTTIPNRRFINMTLEKQIMDKNYWVGILDLDYFKRVNDGMGHIFGDECLVKIAALLSKEILKYDSFIGRFGGEEFLIVLSDSTVEKGMKIMRSLIEIIEKERIIYTYFNQQSNLTISIGAVFIDEPANSVNAIIGEADQALYKAKVNGRNQLVIANGDWLS
ncbi:MAG: GGDEF domain-containing protein [Clostridiales bacterium]|nr:GGDEF domain-containing protein [Clostridiales bacterium]